MLPKPAGVLATHRRAAAARAVHGKTIQAGLLLRQAWLAGRARRMLVLAPKAVCRQWQIELREKFNLSWLIYDGSRLTCLESPARRDIENTERSVERGR